MKIEPLVLEGAHVRLEPLELRHTIALERVALDPRIWEFSRTQMQVADDVTRYVQAALATQSAGTAMPFATVERSSGTVIGSTRFESIDVDNRRVEIGWSWLNPRWWRTPINTEAKFLMLRHAFEHWGAVRVEFKTLVSNERSRIAVTRIGAIQEGIFRRYLRHPDGSHRDAVYYSILEDEWPGVRGILESRLKA